MFVSFTNGEKENLRKIVGGGRQVDEGGVTDGRVHDRKRRASGIVGAEGVLTTPKKKTKLN